MKPKNSSIFTKLIFILISIICMFNLIYSISYDPYWYDTNQSYRITFNITGSTADITNTTLILNINQTFMGSNYNFTTHKNSTRIYYYNNTGNNYVLTNHYAINWNTTNSNGTIQFKAPYLKANSNTTYIIYFGDTSKINVENYCLTYIYCDFFNDSSINSQLSTVDNDLVANTLFNESNTSLLIRAGGADTWTGNDEYGSVYLNDISGDLDIKVAVLTQSNPNVWAKAGIMIKNDMTQRASSTGYIFNVITPGNGYSYQRDTNNNGYLDLNTNAGSPSITASYLRVLKNATSFTGYYSKTNMSSWTSIAASTITSANTIQDIGLSYTSHAGATLGNATFTNFTVERYNPNINYYSTSQSEELLEYLNNTITSPSILITSNVLQNNTLEINASIYCYSYRNQSCSNISSYIQYNNTLSSFTNISTSSTTPIWSLTSNPQSCILNANQSCNLSWRANLTGTENSNYLIRIYSISNNSRIQPIISENLSIKIVLGSTLSFNQSSYIFENITKSQGAIITTLKVKSDTGNNTNIRISCESGNCNQFSLNWINGTNLTQAENKEFNITCLDNNIGSFNAIYNVTSNEFNQRINLNVSCTINPLYGPLSIIQINPFINLITVKQNKTFNYKANISCQGICGNITGYARFYKNDWYNDSFNYRQQINLTINTALPNNYQILLYLNSSRVGSNFNWSNNCNDIRFVNSNNTLSYWTQNCNTTSKEIYVWVKTNSSLSASSNYIVDMYYGNNNAITQSSANNTFIQDSVYLITGRCSGAGNCDMDSHAEADTLRAYINSSGMGIDGNGYVTAINDIDNPYGTDDNYFSRYRLLFIPSISASYTFGTYTDDDSEVATLPYDGYGYGINTTHTFGAHDVITTQYASWHNNGACGANTAIEGSRSLTSQTGYWIDFLHIEGTGGEDQVMCLSNGSGFNTFTSTNYPGQIYARNYVNIEPQITNILTEESLIISTNSSSRPFFTINSQPQSCLLSENSSCILEWNINASGNINDSSLLEIYAYSNYSNILSNRTDSLNVTINALQIPLINLSTPLNNSQILLTGNTSLEYNIFSTDSNLTCDIYINNIFNKTEICTDGLNIYSINLTNGNYNWSIRVNATDGSSISDMWNFSLYSVPTIPLSINSSPSSLYAGVNFTVNASGSYDADGDSITYEYKFYNLNDSILLLNWSTINYYNITLNDTLNTIRVYARALGGGNMSSEYSQDFNVQEEILINLIYPLNNEKVIFNQNITLVYNITSVDSNLTCQIYINSILNKTSLCYNGINNESIQLNSGDYNWSVIVNNTLSSRNSATYNLSLIQGYELFVSKRIVSINTDIYTIILDINNSVNSTQSITPVEFLDSKMNSGSFSTIYDFLNLTSGSNFNGDIFGWDINLNSYESTQINYSITKNTPDYNLLDEFIIGLD